MSKLAEFQSAWAPRVLSIVRIMAALLFMEHGLQKLFGFPPSPMDMSHLPPLLIAAAWIEIVGGVLMLLGLFTKPVAFVLSGQMAAGYFLVHAQQGFFPANNGGDAAILFSFIFLYFFCAGGGAWSVDAVIARSKTGT